MGKQRVIIVGCGFGGLAAARELAHRRLPDLEILAFNRTPVLYNYPILPRLLLADVAATLVDRPLTSLLDPTAVTLYTERVETIDPASGQLATAHRTHAFDYLILAPGGRAIPIDQDDGFPVYYPKSARHLVRLREELPTLCAPPSEPHRFVVVGGGLTGIEFAASLGIAARRLSARHHGRPDSVTVTLVEQQQRIAPACHPRLSRRLTQQLNRLHIDVETGCRVDRIARDHLRTGNGPIPADRVLCCIGSRPDLRFTLQGVESDDGRLPVGPTLQLAGADRVFVVGDALVHSAPPHQETKRASHAIRQGREAARNVIRLARGSKPTPYTHPVLPALVSLGVDYALMEYRGVCLGGAGPAHLKHYLETRW